MAINNMIIYFSLNLNDLKIIQCSEKEYINLDYNAFFNKALNNINVIEKYDSNIVLESLNKCKTIHFHSNDKNDYIFDITSFDKNIVNCAVYVVVNEVINKDTNIDFLTGIYNRSYLTKEIESRLKNHRALSYALGIIDLNNFKNINDKYGHLAGDKVLKSFANEIKESVGNVLLGRYGGDEFILFIENPTLEQLTDISKKILAISYKQNNDKKNIVTACLGFSKTNGEIFSFEYLFEQADIALYKAKKSGKKSAYLDDNILYSNNKLGIRNRNKITFRLFDEEIRHTKNLMFISCLLAFILFLGVLILASLSFGNRISSINFNEANNTMSMVSEQIETNVDKSIESCLSQLNMVIQIIDNTDLNQEDYKSVLEKIGEQLLFEDVGFLLPSGDIIFKDKNYNIAQEKIAIEVIINKKSYIENIYFNKYGEKMVFAIPYLDGKYSDTISSIVGIVSVDEFKNYLVATAFNGTSTVAITDNDGNFVSKSGNQEFEKKNLLTSLRYALGDDLYYPVKEVFQNKESKTIDVNLCGVDTFLYFDFFNDAFDNNLNWHIIITIPVSEINKSTTEAFNLIVKSYSVLGFVVLIAVIVSMAIFFSIKIKITRNTYIDDVTEGLNYNRFIIDAKTLSKTSSDYAVVLTDTIKFKYINEQIGKQKGDDLLKSVHDYYLSKLAKDELIARVYADRFILFIHNNDIENRLLAMYDEVKKKIFKEYNITLYNVYGVFNPNKKIYDVAFSSNMARVALLSIKDNYALTPIGFFENSMYVNEVTLNTLEQKADSAMRNHNFIVYYQGKRNIQNETWCSCEALVRWKDTDGTLISPGKFIPLFERNGFITQLDLYIFENVCCDIRRAIDNGKKPIAASINVSRKHFINKDFLSNYKEIIDKYDIPYNLIEFEITESAVFENENILVDIVNQIHQMGCTCSIDDFGTGYSSLSMLTNYDFDIIKLDRSFFYGKNGFTDSSKQVVKTLIDLAHKLNKKVVAEGIEELEVVNFLKDIKCDIIQGFYYARPLPKDEFLKLVSE